MDSLKKFPLNCPACGTGLNVSAFKCPYCTTEVKGSFTLPLFLKLTHQEQEFVMEFLKSSGSLKDMAKSMGVSYPTVRNYLDELIAKISKLEER